MKRYLYKHFFLSGAITALALLCGIILSPQKVFAAYVVVDSYWSADNPTETYYGLQGMPLNNIGFQSVGDVTYLEAYLSYGTNYDDVSYYYLKDFYGNVLDCRTATSSVSGFGIPFNGVFGDPVRLEFSGSQCLVSSSDLVDRLYIYRADGSNDTVIGGDWDYSGYPSFRVWSGSIVEDNTETRIISMLPANGTTTASGQPVYFELNGYINPDDWGKIFKIKIDFRNLDLNTITASLTFGQFSIDQNIFYSNLASSSGYFTISSTTNLVDGNYRVEARLWNAVDFPFGLSMMLTEKVFVQHQFIVGQATFLGNLATNMYNEMNEIFASSTATTTAASSADCNPAGWILGETKLVRCLAFLFVPDSKRVSDSMVSLYNGILRKWPLGYVTDFWAIMGTTSTTSLELFNAVIPPGIPGAGSQLTLDLTGSIDYILYATSGPFISGNATSTETFYDITSRYWRIFIYLAAFLYILRRILGVDIIPTIGGGGGSNVLTYSEKRKINKSLKKKKPTESIIH
jgi:hypothetical protein